MSDEFLQGKREAAAEKYAIYAHRLDILGETTAKDAGGADRKSAGTTLYSNIPFKWGRNKQGARLVVGDKPIAYGNYLFTFATYQNGTRVNLRAGYKLKVLNDGYEPEKIFSIVELFDNQGVEYQVEAKKES